MARVPKGRRKRAKKRDGDKCGIHLGGCGRRIQWDRKNIPPGDHIIPESLFSKMAPTPDEFQEDWNIQPVHEECGTSKDNRVSGQGMGELKMLFGRFANTPDKWPLFHCNCHFLQVYEEDLYVCTRGIVEESKHKLLPNFVKDFGDSDRQDAIFVPEFWKSAGTSRAGYSDLGKTSRGYVLPSIPPRRVHGFNLAEALRVGLPTPDLIYVDERGSVTPMESTDVKQQGKDRPD